MSNKALHTAGSGETLFCFLQLKIFFTVSSTSARAHLSLHAPSSKPQRLMQLNKVLYSRKVALVSRDFLMKSSIGRQGSPAAAGGVVVEVVEPVLVVPPLVLVPPVFVFVPVAVVGEVFAAC